jgi:hypothetical protein
MVDIDHLQLDVRLLMQSSEESSASLDEDRVVRLLVMPAAGEVVAAHEVDRPEVMAPADLVGKHAAQAAIVDLKVRPALSPAEVERTRAQPVGIDKQHRLKHDQSGSGTSSIAAGNAD